MFNVNDINFIGIMLLVIFVWVAIGFVILIKRIEKLEEKIEELEKRSK